MKQKQVLAELWDFCFPSQPLNCRGGQSKVPAATDSRPGAVPSVPCRTPAPIPHIAGVGVRSRFQTESLREGEGSLHPARGRTGTYRTCPPRCR